jgi:phenylalanyl-tRNA synthetase alpha chain
MIADPHNNVTENVYSKLGVNLHRRTGHPLCTIREAIYEYFDDVYKGSFNTFDDLLPIVSTQSNFDSVLVPENHVSRSLNDTYYVDANTVLRCAGSAHCAVHPPFCICRNNHTQISATGTHNIAAVAACLVSLQH